MLLIIIFYCQNHMQWWVIINFFKTKCFLNKAKKPVILCRKLCTDYLVLNCCSKLIFHMVFSGPKQAFNRILHYLDDVFKGEPKETFKKLLTDFLCDIWSENFLFYYKTCFLRKMWVPFIPFLMLFSKIACYFSRLSWALKPTSL